MSLKRHFPLILLIFLICVIEGCHKDGSYHEIKGSIWHTGVDIKYRSPVNLKDSIYKILREIDNSLSVFNDSSLTSRINRNDSSAKCDEMLTEVFHESQRINNLSNGAFDPTLAPLVDLWGFGRDGEPDSTVRQKDIEAVLKYIGIRDCSIDSHKKMIKKDPKTEFDFSAIAKGYACDRIGSMLTRNGVRDYLIEIGGELLAHGVNPEGEAWKVMIEDPSSEKRTDFPTENSEIVTLDNVAIATSGSYRNFRIEEGKRISHIINPKTGYPVETAVVSASVIAPGCMTADAIATACMAMPLHEAVSMASEIPEIKVRLVVYDIQTREFKVIKINF